MYWYIAIFLLLLAGWRTYVFYRKARHESPVEGLLQNQLDTSAGKEFIFGSFQAVWKSGKGKGYLEVASCQEPEKVIWSTVPGKSFLAVGLGKEKVSENRGSFWVREFRREVLHHQTVENMKVEDNCLVIGGRLHDARKNKETPYRFLLTPQGSGKLGFALTTPDYPANRSYLTLASDPGEAFLGFGIQFSYVNMKGKRLPVFVREQGIGRGAQPLTFLVNLVAGAGGSWHTTYAAVPHYITNRMRGLFLENYAFSIFDLRTPHRVQIELFESDMRGQFLYGNSPPELIAAYTAYAGRMRPLPDWIMEGAVAGMQGGTERVREVWSQLQQHETPLAAFWLQDWVGQRTTIVGRQLWWNWELDTERYPAWEKLVADLGTENIRILTYINTFLADVADHTTHKRDLHNEALERGFMVKRENGEPYRIKNTDFSASLVDFSNPEAYDWMQSVIHEQLISSGVSGWMADYGEALPYDARLYSGEPAVTFHNRYPEIWAKLNRQTIEKLDDADEMVFFMRSGYTQSLRYATLFWLGDQNVTWDEHDGIKTAVTGLLSSGISGFAFNHSDIGGFTSVSYPVINMRRSQELLLRWMDLNAFTVIYRTHEGIQPEENVQFYQNEDTLKHFSRMARVYKAWAPYRKALVQEASETGLPVVRHPFIHYPEDERFYDLRYEMFMLGSDLLVAPVLDPGVQAVVVLFPEGVWLHLWSGKEYRGPAREEVDAPIGRPAVFYLQGSKAGEELAAALEEMGLLT